MPPKVNANQYGDVVVVRVVVVLLPYGVAVVVVCEESGGTTTVTSRGGGEPSPLLELQAPKANVARTRAAGTILLCVIVQFLFCC
jgi:hypothetical protein